MAHTFPNYPVSYGAQNQLRPRIKSIRFGDGYEMRIVDGLNTVPQRWTVSWNVLGLPEAEHADTFLAAHRGALWFWWTPPRQTQPIKVVCKEWTRAPVDGSPHHDSITATFEQVFDLQG